MTDQPISEKNLSRDYNFLVMAADPAIRHSIASGLRVAGHRVEEADKLASGLRMVQKNAYAAAIIDLSIQRISLAKILGKLRLISKLPVLFVMASPDIHSGLESLAPGGEDFLVKPVDERELLIRLLRLAGHSSLKLGKKTIEIGRLIIDSRNRQIFLNRQLLEFTPTEFDLLARMSLNPGELVPRRILQKVLNRKGAAQDDAANNLLDVYIMRLRKKLLPGMLVSRRGFGNMLNP